jgi:hypothetical protein
MVLFSTINHFLEENEINWENCMNSALSLSGRTYLGKTEFSVIGAMKTKQKARATICHFTSDTAIW